MSQNNYIVVAHYPEFDAGIYSIGELRKMLTHLAGQAEGDDTLLQFDAGANNISLDIVRKVPKEKKEKKLTKEQELVAAAQKVAANTYLDDNVINRHTFTTVSCKALKELFEAAGINK